MKSIEEINGYIKEYRDADITTKDISDGYHTFGDLYYHRAILFLALQEAYPHLSWKSRKHHDGTMFDGMFIVGINTPQGQYTYHYNMDLWDLFDVPDLITAPEYDGHLPEDVPRLLTLAKQKEL